MPRNYAGILSTLFSPAAFRSYIAKRQGLEFDQRHDTDTFAPMPLPEMSGVDHSLIAHAVQYEVSSIPKIRRALKSIARAATEGIETFSFIDVGSGKGLVTMIASLLPFRRVIGVEMSPALHEIAAENNRRFRARVRVRSEITLVCADALRSSWPEGNLVFYLYNPFDEAFTIRFIERLKEETSGSPREVILAYVNPLHDYLFQADGLFRQLFSDGTLTVYCLLYDSHANHGGAA